MSLTAELEPTSQDAHRGSESLRVALLNPCYWPEVRRGAERMARELADGLIAQGHRVRLITSHSGMPSRTSEGGMEVLRLWRPPDGRLRRRFYDDHLTHAPFSYLALRAGRDDVAHALAAPDAIAAGRWRRRGSGIAVFSYVGMPARAFLVSRRRRLEAIVAACRAADQVVALSRAAADAFFDDLGVRARVIHPGVDTGRLTPGHGRSERPTIFCNASLEIAYKRVELLLRALPLVRRSRPGTRLVLLRPRDARLAARVQSDVEGVDLVAPDPGGDDALLLENYRRAWVSVLPSRAEAFGLVLVESLACGTPVVGADDGGIREVIDRPEIGRLFDGEERSLAAAVLEAIELSEDAGTVAACRARALGFSSAGTAAAYEALYRELLG